MRNLEQLIFYGFFNHTTNFSLNSTIYNIKGTLCKYLISIVEKYLLFCYNWGVHSISAPSIYFRSTYGQIIKLAKKPRPLIFKI
jgi:hypothetical protein